MTGENNTYGFIANTIATNAKDESSDVGNDALVVPWKDILDLNTNRTILKVININKQEPIKVKVRKNNDDKLKIEVTYSANKIEKILDEDGNILSENSTIAITVPKLKREGIYKYIIIDNIGNIKEIKVKIENVFRYQIPDLETLKLFRDIVNEGNDFAGKTVEVVADIDMNPGKYTINEATGEITFDTDAEKWTSIGTSETPFKGTFNGGYYTLTGMYINESMYHDVGFFGRILEEAVVKNVIIKQCYVYNYKDNDTEPHTASIVGANYGIIENCASIKGIISGKQTGASTSSKMAYTGGIVGYNANTIKNCYNTSQVTQTVNTTTTYCHARVGGICGVNTGQIINCYNTGNIKGTGGYVYAGGCVGVTYASKYSQTSTTEVNNCYNYGTVSGTGKSNSASNAHKGEVIGSVGTTSSSGATTNNCYCLKNVNYLYEYYDSTWKNSGNKGKTDANTLKTYANRVNGFSVLGDAYMEDKWNINNGYPILIWQVPDWQFTEKNTCIAIGETIDIDVIDIGKNMLHKNQGGFTWTSSDRNIATVDNNGIVTGVSVGEVEIEAKYGDIELKTKVNVIDKKQENTDTITYIYTAKDLVDFRDDVNRGNNYANKTVQVMSDIDLSTICGQKIGSWEPIGIPGVYFTGTFTGDYHKISNAYMNYKSDSNSYIVQALFYRVVENSVIKNLYIENINVKNVNKYSIHTGGITGYNYGTIENVMIESGSLIGICVGNDGTSSSYRSSYIGGICGINTGTIKECINKATINGESVTTNSYTQSMVGGITGLNNNATESTNAIVENCYNAGTVKGIGYLCYVGGCAGSNRKNNPKIENCYSYGNTSGSGSKAYIGGIVGLNGTSASNAAGIINNSYCLNNSKYSYYYYSGGVKNYDPDPYLKSESELKQYASTLGDAYTDDITPNINNGYPILRWQQLPENR